MSKPTVVSAAGAAMPDGQETPTLLNVADRLDQTRLLIIATSNLVAGGDAFPDSVQAVINAAEDALDSARAMLKAIRGEQKADVANV